jgi:hypothetical protein
MYRHFGNIPRTNSYAASGIADAAQHVENLLRLSDPNVATSLGSEQFPRQGTAIPDYSDAHEVVEELDSLPPPKIAGQDDSSYEGAVGGVGETGIEYLAFYKSFRDVSRKPAPKLWGIFFIKSRCVALATDMSYSTGESFPDCLEGLAAFLYSHELYHYWFDAHCLQMEATGGLPVYRPYRSLVARLPMTEWHEESVANFYGLNALKPKEGFSCAQPIRDFLWDMVALSPGAYSGGIDKRQTARRNLMVEQASASLQHRGPSEWLGLVESIVRMGTVLSKRRESSLSQGLHLEACPVYWIDWVKGGKSIVVPQTASVSEVNNDFIRRYLAGVQDHHSDHSYYRIDNGEKIKLPNPHRADLTNREFHNIIGKAGMTSPQFYKERARTSVWRKGVPRSPILPPRFSARGVGS